MNAAAPESCESTPPPPASRRRRRVALRTLALQLLLPFVVAEPLMQEDPRATASRPRLRGVGAALRDGARVVYVQLVLPGLADFVAAAAAALVRVVAPPPAPPPVLDLPSARRPTPPVPKGWTPTIRVGGPAPVAAVVHRVLPVLPQEVKSLDDRIRCPSKGCAILSVGACLAFQDEAQVRLQKRLAEKRERAPSAYEPARPVFTLHECLDCEIGRVATARWRFRRAAHARLNPKKRTKSASSRR